MEEISVVQAEEILQRLAGLRKEIARAEQARDDLIQHYANKIQRATDLCKEETLEARNMEAFYLEMLRRYTAANLKGRKKSLAFPSGVMRLSKQQPEFYFNQQKVDGKNAALIDFVKKSAPEFLKVKTVETADWSRFKQELIEVGDKLALKDSGEIVEGLAIKHLPDKFEVDIDG